MAINRELRRFKKPVNDPYDFEYVLRYALVDDATDTATEIEEGQLIVSTGNTEANLALFTTEIADAATKQILDWVTA